MQYHLSTTFNNFAMDKMKRKFQLKQLFLLVSELQYKFAVLRLKEFVLRLNYLKLQIFIMHSAYGICSNLD